MSTGSFDHAHPPPLPPAATAAAAAAANGGPFLHFPAATSTPLATPTPTMASHDPRFTAWATVTAAGARISVPDCAASLTIPPGALAPGQSADIFLAVVTPAQVAAPVPTTHPRETPLSPIVCCGPSEVTHRLKKPVVVSLGHCASLRHGHWSVAVVTDDDEDDRVSSWRRVVTLGQETINTPAYAQLDLNACHVVSDRLPARLALIGESAQTGAATKSLRLAAFAQDGSCSSAGGIAVRVYVLPDTDDALAFAVESERRYNGRLLDRSTSMLFTDCAENLSLRLDALSSGWSCGTDFLEVPFSHVWSCANPALHCSFTLKSVQSNSNSSNNNNNDDNDNRLCFTLEVTQGESNSALLSVDCNLSSSSSSSSSPGHTLLRAPSSGSGPERCRLSQALLNTLSGLLDPPNAHGTDWRLLAERLNVHRYLTYFATRTSPTEAILGLWEARNRENLAVSNLANVLRGMGRFDAAMVLERA